MYTKIIDLLNRMSKLKFLARKNTFIKILKHGKLFVETISQKIGFLTCAIYEVYSQKEKNLFRMFLN
jgi:hypothetical protein